MKLVSSLFTSSFFIALAAAPPAPQMASDCSPWNPKCRGVMVELYGEALFLQPNGSSLYYAVQADPFDEAIAVPEASPNWFVYEITPNYAPAFKVGAKLLFSDTDTNIEASWERVYTHKKASHQVPTVGDMIGPIFDIGPNSAPYGYADAKAKFHFDAVNLVFGQQFCAFKRLYPNIYAGAAFARIKQTLRSEYSNTSGSFARSVSSYSTFMGAGPEVGFDFDYRIAGGFFFSGSSSIALIIGESQNGTTYSSVSPVLKSIPQPNVQTTTVPNRTQLIPALEEKLGFSYSALFDCWKLTFAAGYQAQVYIDAVQSIDMTAPQVLPSLNVASPTIAVFAVGFERTLSNFLLTGPYISLSVVF